MEYPIESPQTRNAIIRGLLKPRFARAKSTHFSLGMPRMRFRGLPFLNRRPLNEWLLFGSLVFFALLCTTVYFVYVEPWIDGGSNIRIGADSDRFWDFAKNLDQLVIFSATENSLGPVGLIILLKSGFAIMLVNFAMLLIALKIAFSMPRINKALFGFLILINAEILPSVSTVNKEIFALLAAVMTVKYFQTRSKPLLLATIFVLACARWEGVAILALYLAASRLGFRSRPKTFLALIILSITVLYPFAFKIVGVDPSAFDYLLEGANTIIKLNDIQNSFGFPLVVIPKAIMLIGGGWASPNFYIGNPIFSPFDDYQQVVFQPLGCLALILLLYAVWKTGRLGLDRPVTVLALLTIVITEASPFIQPRYVFGVYVMLAVQMALPAPVHQQSDQATTRTNHAVAPAA